MYQRRHAEGCPALHIKIDERELTLSVSRENRAWDLIPPDVLRALDA
jgi:hypothetical protein